MGSRPPYPNRVRGGCPHPHFSPHYRRLVAPKGRPDMFANLGGFHLIILLAIVLLIFGAAKLPALAKSVGQSTRIFKGEMRGLKNDEGRSSHAEDAADVPTPDSSATQDYRSTPTAVPRDYDPKG